VKRPPNRQVRMKRVKKALAILWSKAVRSRDGNRCVLCGATENLAAHHWLYHKAHSLSLAYNVGNGATLCYSCHIIKIHRRADGATVLRLAEKMTDILGPGTIDEMREIVKDKDLQAVMTLEDLELLRVAFEELV